MRNEMLWLLLCTLLGCFDQLSGNTPDNNQGINMPQDVVEGDIRLNPTQLVTFQQSGRRKARAVMQLERHKWPLGIVPYDLSPNLTQSAHSVIIAAITQYMTDTCIRFRKKQAADFDHLYFYSGDACMSFVGRQGGQQNISIGPSCELKGVVMHEIFHALGRWHEHSRDDRDSYVRVNTDNILEDKTSNFRIVTDATTQEITYDYDSIMHYDAYAFSKNNEPTIEPLDSSVSLTRIGQRSTFSEQDITHIQSLYCEDSEWSNWSIWGSCSKSCGLGTRRRTRTCLGTKCYGDNVSIETCNHGNCPLVSGWSEWSLWSACSRTCGRGQMLRVRSCGGGECEGDPIQYQECVVKQCPREWGPWGEWTPCSSTCEGGMSTRVRICLPSSSEEEVGGACVGPREEKVPCNVNISCTGVDPTDEEPECLDILLCSGATKTLSVHVLVPVLMLFLNWFCTHRIS